jgi:hypothetical protein
MTVADIAKQIVSFDTYDPPTKEKPLEVWIGDFLKDLGTRVV